MKKLVLFLLTLCLFATVLTGCGGNGKSVSNKAGEDINKKPEYVLVKATSVGSLQSADKNIKINSNYTFNVNANDLCEYTYTYDKNGNMLTMDSITEGGGTESAVWTYNKDNQKLTYVKNSIEGKTTSTEWTYDNDGNMLTKTFIAANGNTAQSTWTYDNNGNMLSETLAEADGSTTKSAWTYNGDNKKVSGTKINPNNSKIEYSWTYHDNGKMATEKLLTYDKNGVHDSTAEHVYDTHGKQILDCQTLPSSTAKHGWAAEYTYDNNGNVLTKQSKTADGKNSGGVTTYRYDNGNLVEISGDGGTTSYQYDAKGNVLNEKHEALVDGVKEMQYEIIYERDNDGKLLKETKKEWEFAWDKQTQQGYRRDKTRYIHSYTYHPNGEVSYKSETDYNSEKELTYKYDEHGNIIEYTVWYMDKGTHTKFTATFEYEKL